MGSVAEVIGAFLRLGCTSFGGPVAHLGYFHREFVTRRSWLDDGQWASTVAMCQLLPGPTSTQVAFSLGMRRAGLMGAMAAWAAFTLPSAAVLAAAGAGLVAGGTEISGAGWLAGLRALAVAAVARAAWSMARALGGGGPLIGAAACTVAVLAVARAFGGVAATAAQVGVIVAAAAVGIAMDRGDRATGTSRGAGAVRGAAANATVAREPATARLHGSVAALMLAALVALSFASAGAPPVVQAAATCLRAGSLVVGGGHVVLPLIERPFVEHAWLPEGTVIAAYALAQAVPGPLFTMVAFLGAALGQPDGPWAAAGAAALMTASVFAPGLLLVVAAMPAWNAIAGARAARGAMRGATVAVTGVLVAALADPVVPAGITDFTTACIAAGSLALLARPRVPVVAVVALAALAGALLA
jgi:chromate transporter